MWLALQPAEPSKVSSTLPGGPQHHNLTFKVIIIVRPIEIYVHRTEWLIHTSQSQYSYNTPNGSGGPMARPDVNRG